MVLRAFSFSNYRCFFTAIGLLFCVVLQAQFTPRIGSAEPGNTPGPGTVGKRVLQFQQGYSYGNLRLEEADIFEDATTYDSIYGQRRHVQTNVIRYGIMERLELRARLNYNNSKVLAEGNGAFSNAASRNGLGFDLGFRFSAIHLPDAGFNLGVQTDLGLVYADITSIHGATQSSGFLLVSQRFATNFVLTLNAGYMTNSINSDFLVGRTSLRYFHQNYLFHLGYTYQESISTPLNKVHSNAYFLAIAYYVTDDVLLNVESSVEKGFSGRYQNTEGFIQENTLNIGLGLSWRLNFRN